MITTIKLPPEIETIHRRLKDDTGMLRSLVTTMDLTNQIMLGEILEERFRTTGTHSLGVRSHRLWDSMRATRASVVGKSVVSGMGSNVKYLGVHEFGSHKTVQVGPSMRKRSIKTVIFGKRRVVRVGDVHVSAHAMKQNFPERAPLRLGLEARRERYAGRMAQGVTLFYKGK